MHLNHRRTLSGRGERAEEFRVRLAGIAVDESDRLWAVGDREIKQFSPDGRLERQIPTRDAGWSISADSEALWVGFYGAIDRLDQSGRRQASIEEPDRLGLVTAVAVRGEILVAADATHRTIHLYRNGQWQREVGREVNTRGFMLPNGVLDLSLDDADGATFVVAHPQKHRVERYDLEGELAGKFGRFGMNDPADFGGCCNPTNITTTWKGHIVVSEKAPPRVKVYSGDGAFLAQSDDGRFDANTKNIDLAADRQGRVYATDPLRCTIEVFDLTLNGD